MTPLLFAAICAAGGVGAALRLLVDGWCRGALGDRLPWGTLVINVTGSLLLGLVTGLALAHGLPAGWRSVLGTGLLGGYTTFSTAAWETVRLLGRRDTLGAAVTGLGMLVLGVAAAAAGLALGQLG